MKKKRIVLSVYFTSLLLFAPMFSLRAEANIFENIDISPHGEIRQSFDDNITFAHEDAKSDGITKLSAGLTMEEEKKNYSYALDASVIQQLYFTHSSFNNNAQNLTASVNKVLSKYDTLKISDTFLHSEEPRSFEDDFGRTSGRYSYYRNRFDTQYTHDISKHLSAQANYGNTSYRVSRSDLTDSFTQRFGLGLNYNQTTATIYRVMYEYLISTFDPGGDASVNAILAGVKHYLTKQIYFDLNAGASIVEAVDGSSSTKPNVTLSLTKDLNETDSVSIAYKQTSSPSSYSSDIFNSWRVEINGRWQLLKRLAAKAILFYGEGEFKDLSFTDRQTGITTQMTYELKKDIQTFLGYTYANVDSNSATREYRRNLIELGLQFNF